MHNPVAQPVFILQAVSNYMGHGSCIGQADLSAKHVDYRKNFFFWKGQVVNLFSFAGHRFSPATARLHLCSMKAALSSMC